MSACRTEPAANPGGVGAQGGAQTGRSPGGGWTEAEPPALRNQMLWGIPPPRQDRFRLSRTDTETHTWETEFTQLITNYKVRHIITTYTDTQLCAQLNHKCNVNVSPYKNPRTRPYSIQIMQWHERWRPHASQWPKPAYQMAYFGWFLSTVGDRGPEACTFVHAEGR